MEGLTYLVRMALIAFLVLCIIMLAIAGLGALGGAVTGTCDPNAPASDGRSYGQCFQQGFDTVDGLIDLIPHTPRP